MSGAKPGAAVGDLQRDAAVVRRRAQDDVAGAVAQRVVDQVAERLAQPQRVGADRHVAVLDEDRAAGAVGAVGEAVADALEQRPHAQRLAPHRQLALLRPGEDEQVLGELREAVDLLDGRRRSPGAGRDRGSAASSSVLSTASGVRSSWLASATKRRSRSIEPPQPGEQRVQRLAEPVDLVVRGRQRQPLVAGARRGGASPRPAACALPAST